MPQTEHAKVNKGRAGKFLSLIVGVAAIVGFGVYAASSHNTKNSHAEPVNIYSANCAGPNYPTLKLGNMGNCVYYLQQIFHDSGFAVPVTGKFDATTNSAVVFFQYNAKLPDNGVVDMATWGALGKYGKSTPGYTPPSTSSGSGSSSSSSSSGSSSGTSSTPSTPSNPYASSCQPPRPILQFGATGNCVKFLQQIFKDSGFAVPVTGTFDNATLSGVVFYQSNKKQTANGIVNGTTWGDLTGNSQVTTQILGTAVPAYLPNDPYLKSCEAPRPILQLGATSNCVKLLQQIFHDVGFGIQVTGTFDAQTRSAVVFYQANKNLPDNGVVNGATWGALTGSSAVTSQTLGTGVPSYLQNNPYDAQCQAPRPTLQESATGNCVKYLQQIFKNAGFGTAVNGTFDPATKSAVVYYQSVKGLPANGVVNGATWYALTYDGRVNGQVLGTGTWTPPSSGSNGKKDGGGGGDSSNLNAPICNSVAACTFLKEYAEVAKITGAQDPASIIYLLQIYQGEFGSQTDITLAIMAGLATPSPKPVKPATCGSFNGGAVEVACDSNSNPSTTKPQHGLTP